MAELTDELKLEVVTRLARFEAPADIVAELGQRGIECDRTQIGSYDPTRSYYQAGDQWREIFEAARKAYVEDVSVIPIANQGFRLNELLDLYAKAKKQKNYKLAAELMEQASKEAGGIFSNERNVNINDSRRQAARDMSAEDRKLAFAELIRSALEGMQTPGAEPQHPVVQ